PCNGSTAVSPAEMPAIIAVGGSGIVSGIDLNLGTNVYYDFVGNYYTSQWDVGSCIALFAPGVSIIGATNTGDNASNTLSGTSFAAPIVAGVAAMYLQTHAHVIQSDVKNALINAALTGQLLECLTTNGTTTHLYYLG